MFKNILLSEKIKKIFFLLSFLIMLGGVIFPQIILEQKRHITHGTDDHLAYVVKAANIKDCIDYKKNECAGLRSIHDQSINSLETVGNKPYYATRQTHRLLFSYHPAYSYSLIFISKFFDISLEKSQFIFEMIIGPSSALAVAFFLYTFFGIIVASIIMPFLAFHLIGSGWGIHHYAPYIVAIQPILIAMALVTKKKFTYNFFALLLMILSSAFHPSGIIMSGAIVLFSFIINDKRFTPKQIFFYLSSFVVFIFYFYQIKFLPVDLSISEFYRENDLLQIIKFNIKTFLGLVKNDSKILFNLGLCLPFFLLGAYRILKNKFRIDLLLPLLITIIFVFLLATFFPSPSTSLFKRTWIITSLFLLGIIGYGIKELFGDFVIHVESKRIKSFEHLLQNLKSNSSYVAVIALALIFLLSSINNLRQTYMHYLDLHIWDSNIYLEKTSIKELSTKIKKDQKILFHFPHIELSEPIIYHFLANGGNKIANIWPIINSTYKKQINKNVRYMLSLSPMNSINSYGIQQTYFYRKKNIPITRSQSSSKFI